MACEGRKILLVLPPLSVNDDATKKNIHEGKKDVGKTILRARAREAADDTTVPSSGGALS